MDVRLQNGDLSMTEAGALNYVHGVEEAVQRVRIAASVRKGDFIYQRGLGTDYGTLSADDPMIREKLDLLIREATAGIVGADIRVVSFNRARMVASVMVITADGQRTTEVNLNGILRTNP